MVANQKPISPHDDTDSVPCLVVQNGKHLGAARPLRSPITFLGSGSDCDVRVNVEGVLPHHCLVAQVEDGILFRDLGSAIGTLVNGEPVGAMYLRSGDVLTVGPFHFELRIPETWNEAHVSRESLKQERATHRVQIAAVAAQQMSLSEKERDLERRTAALRLQEKQLAEHLETKRQELLGLKEECKQDRTALKEERTEQEQQLQATWDQLHQTREKIERLYQEAEQEKQRTIDLRNRQKQTFQQRWKEKSKAVAKREQAVEAESARLDEDCTRFREHIVKFNTEIELTRRQLCEDRQLLEREKQAWQEKQQAEQTRVQQREQEFTLREQAVRKEEARIARERATWEQLHEHLQRDLKGLDSRIRHQRTKLVSQEQQLTQVQTALAKGMGTNSALPTPAPVVASSTPQQQQSPEHPEKLLHMRKLDAELTDQRQHLLEQWGGLVETHQKWHQERATLVDELDRKMHELAGYERTLQSRAESLRQREEAMNASVSEATGMRASLEAEYAKLRRENLQWERNKGRLAEEIQAREQAAENYKNEVKRTRDRCMRRLRKDLKVVTEIQQDCEKARVDYFTALEELEQHRLALREREQQIAQQELALQRYEQEFLADASDAPAAAKQIERLRRECSALTSREEKLLRKRRNDLRQHRAKIRAGGKKLGRYRKHLARRHKQLLHAQRLIEERTNELNLGELEHERQERLLAVQREQDEQQIEALRQEVEQLIGVLLEVGETEGTQESNDRSVA